MLIVREAKDSQHEIPGTLNSRLGSLREHIGNKKKYKKFNVKSLEIFSKLCIIIL
jgi:hypothetical protein